MPGEDIGTECLRRLLTATTRLATGSAQAILNLQSQRQSTEDVYNQFLEEGTAAAAKRLLRTSLDLARAFEPIQQLCEEITAIENLINRNLAVLRPLAEFPQISQLLTRLINQRDIYYADLPNDVLGELYNHVNGDQGLSNNLDNLLEEGPEVLKNWWAVWNCSSPSVDVALQFAFDPNPPTMMQMTF